MRYLILDDLQSGCYYYRTKLMYDRLGVEYKVIKGDNENVNPKDFDVIVYNRIGTGDPEVALSTARSFGLKVHYDCDDALDLIPSFSPSYHLKKNIHFYYTMLREADTISTSTEYLANYLKKFTDKPIEVRPNVPIEFPKLNLPKNERKRIGFVGSITHIQDVKIVLDALIKLQKTHDFDFYLMGFSESYEDVDNFAWSMREKIDTKDFVDKYKQIKNTHFIKAVDFTAYPLVLSYLNLDIGLCPLEDTEFNRCKSSIKALEYMAAGVKVVASDVTPYQGLDILLAKTTNDFCDIIKSIW